MIVILIVLMVAVAVGIIALLASGIVKDRRSHRTSGGSADASLTDNLLMPHELRHEPRFRTRLPLSRRKKP